MTVAVALPLIKLLVTVFTALVVACFVVAAVCDFMGKKPAVPLFITVAVIALVSSGRLYRQMKELLQLIFA